LNKITFFDTINYLAQNSTKGFIKMSNNICNNPVDLGCISSHEGGNLDKDPLPLLLVIITALTATALATLATCALVRYFDVEFPGSAVNFGGEDTFYITLGASGLGCFLIGACSVLIHRSRSS
jgi:hypothetical protein